MTNKKFKVWDTIEKKWVINPEVEFIHEEKTWGNKFYLEIKEDWFSEDYDPSRYIFVQSTNLKDKNQVEICESDILRIDLGILMDSTEKESNFMYVKVYQEDGGTWMITAVSGWVPSGYSSWTLLDTINNGANKVIEIIGNIYENPELLK